MSKFARQAGSLTFSLLGIVVMAILLIVLNLIFGSVRARIDFTQDRLYTLSDGSKEILAKVESPVTLKFYCTRGPNMPAMFKSFAKRVEDLLAEYVVAGKGKVTLQKFDPQPDSDAEESASLDGVEGQQLQTGERIYLGLAITCVDATEALSVIHPDQENNLEYLISRAIYRVANPDRIKVGIMSALPVMGGPPNPMMMMQQRPQQQPPWLFVQQLRSDYDVEEVSMTASEIPEEIDTLLVMHPKGIADSALYAIDQFVLRGGRLLALVDPVALLDQSQPNQFGMSPPSPSNLEKLFKTWGVTFSDKVVADSRYWVQQRSQQGNDLRPTWLILDNDAVNGDDPVTNSLDRLIIVSGGAFSGDAAEGLEKTVLLRSSPDSQLVDGFRAAMPGDAIAKEFKAEDKEQAMAIRLTGTFKTSFPNGKPESDDAEKEDKDKPAGPENHLTESAEPGAVILVGDADFLYENFWSQQMNFFGQTVRTVTSDNNNLLLNALEQLSGDSSLISIRSRGITSRPLTHIRDMQKEAEQQFREEMTNLEEDLQEVQQKLNELQRTKKDANQRLVLSPEQMAEIEKAREREVEFKRELKELRKKYRRKINRLELRVQLANMVLMPVIIALGGIAFAIYRRSKA